ncbi:MAG TPA: tandem-95 repeat protein, partial [Actinobacteria bacterium]|nr:tandem-95 repeat protein [Actinomycetota bacterium]
CGTATVTVTVTNVAPVVVDDAVTTPEGTLVVIDVVANDIDGNLDPTSTTAQTTPLYGALVNNGDGTFDYTPDTGYVGGDSFTYQVCDTEAACGTATVTVTVTNVAPVVVDDAVTTPEGTLVVIDVVANDIDGNLDPTSTTAQTTPLYGALVNNGDGTFDYTPDTGYVGEDSFTYQVCDTEAACGTATVTIGMLSTSAFASDDFYGASINGTLWTQVDPDADSTFGISRSGNQLVIEVPAVPAGAPHDAWIDATAVPPITFNAPRLMQPAADTNFEIIAKFQSQMTEPEQDQGIIVQQDADTFLRFDVFAYGRDAIAFAAFIDGGPDNSPYSSVAPLGHQPIWLRVTRSGNTWTYSTSSDGSTWTQQLTFDQLMTVTQVGVYAANPSPTDRPAPATRVVVDYFFNGASPIAPEDGGGTIFDIWYGDVQKFGNIGNAQKWIDLLGNVDDPDGIASLSYSLNGGTSHGLSMGPDTRRLLMPGDFDVQISTADPDLVVGTNTVVIVAIDGLGNPTTKTVTFNWSTGNVWPSPYSIDWSTVTDIQDVAQVVDGQWEINSKNLLTVDVGYDRLIDIGDVTSDQYEVLVPMTIRGLDTVNGYDAPSYGPALGILMGWDGHENCSVFTEPACDPSAQPVWGWWPSGSLGELRWTDTFEGLRLVGFNPDSRTELAQSISIGSTYWFKMRVELTVDGPLYSLKIWEDGTTEPTGWQLTDQQGEAGDPVSGSFLLLVHHVDVAIGNVTVTPLP